MEENLIQSFSDTVGQLMLLWQRIRRDILIQEKLNPADKRILYGLFRGGEMTKKALSEAVVLEHSSLTRAIERLEKQKMIKRIASKDDRRFVKLSLTAKGLKKTLDIRQKFLEAIQATISIEKASDKKALVMMIEKIEDMVQQTKQHLNQEK